MTATMALPESPDPGARTERMVSVFVLCLGTKCLLLKLKSKNVIDLLLTKKEVPESKGLRVQRARKELREKMDLQGRKAKQVKPGQPVRMDPLANRAKKDRLDRKAQLAKKDRLAKMDLLARKVLQAKKVPNILNIH